ncbi:MAG TPA: hypothetical protein VK667_03730, partial [Ktedonobacteraceae bacterium]|nr:hypothetical protein [Ktedonobacteraceae bacterium]
DVGLLSESGQRIQMSHLRTTFFGFLAGLPLLIKGFGAADFGHVLGLDLVSILQCIGTIGLGLVAADARRVNGVSK